MLHPFPCLITFNIVGYKIERELNNWCGVSSICNSLHIELHLICSIVCCTFAMPCLLNLTCIILDCASCCVYVMVVYHDVCFFPDALLLDSSGYVAIVRINSTMLVRLLHVFDLLPSGISGKMIVTLDLTTIFAMLVVSMLSLCRATYHLFLKPPKLPWKPLTFSPFLANRCLAMLPLLLSPCYSVVSCRWSWRLLHVGT